MSAFGNPDLAFDKIEEATKLAQVYDDIKDMPEGFETIIGERVSAYQAVKNNVWP